MVKVTIKKAMRLPLGVAAKRKAQKERRLFLRKCDILLRELEIEPQTIKPSERFRLIKLLLTHLESGNESEKKKFEKIITKHRNNF